MNCPHYIIYVKSPKGASWNGYLTANNTLGPREAAATFASRKDAESKATTLGMILDAGTSTSPHKIADVQAVHDTPDEETP